MRLANLKGDDDWEHVMAYVNEYLAEIEDLKREQLQLFMTKLRQCLRDFPVTVAPATVNAIGRDHRPRAKGQIRICCQGLGYA